MPFVTAREASPPKEVPFPGRLKALLQKRRANHGADFDHLSSVVASLLMQALVQDSSPVRTTSARRAANSPTVTTPTI
jgi:hypothetical protein